jgi:hypothetical protein
LFEILTENLLSNWSHPWLKILQEVLVIDSINNLGDLKQSIQPLHLNVDLQFRQIPLYYHGHDGVRVVEVKEEEEIKMEDLEVNHFKKLLIPCE